MYVIHPARRTFHVPEPVKVPECRDATGVSHRLTLAGGRVAEAVSLDALEQVASKPLIVSDDTSKFLEGAEVHGRLQRALRRVPLRYRRQLVAHFVRGESVKEIARREGVPVGAVLSRIFK